MFGLSVGDCAMGRPCAGYSGACGEDAEGSGWQELCIALAGMRTDAVPSRKCQGFPSTLAGIHQGGSFCQ